jgi:SAM-dependent methyltransferase
MMNQNEEDLENYALAWAGEHGKNFSFEAVHSKIRREQALRFILNTTHDSILEIGCGLDPLFPYIPDFNQYFVVEPIHEFAVKVLDSKTGASRVKVINDYFEHCFQEFRDIHLDCIVLNGVLHGVPDPRLLLESIHTICKASSQVYISVSNGTSLHRLLAYEMGIISSPYELSVTNKRYKNMIVFDKNSLRTIVENIGFMVTEVGTYFIKPLSNQQMEAIIDQGITDERIIQGLERLIKYMPEFGSELYIVIKKRP